MPVFLEVRSGSQAGNKIRLEPMKVLRVGRTSRADVAFAEDSHMSGVHFSLGWEGGNWRVADLNSRNGILVNGAAVQAAVLRDGDTIVAGETTFAIRVEPDQPTLASAPAALATPVPTTTPQDCLLPLLRRDLQPLFAILDAARDIRILALLVHYKAECQSLYEGVEGAKLAQVAPYLIRLAPDSALLEPLVTEGWGKSWGVYLTCFSDFHEVRRHLRRFLEVKLPDGEQVYFRFYDPRVMRIYLPTCVGEEANQFFGPIKRYVMEGEKPGDLWEFTSVGRGAEKHVLSLAAVRTRARSSEVSLSQPLSDRHGAER
jgi:pSer/pThr/pTyr-binding forkhead associated (FHA) protein